MKLLAPADKCSGAYRMTAAKGRKLWPVCLRCARCTSAATTCIGSVTPDAQGVAQCAEVLFDGSHATNCEQSPHVGASLSHGGVRIPITPFGVAK